MMYLTETNLFETTKKQFIFKLNAYIGAFTSLMFTQFFGILFSLAGSGSSGGGSNSISFNITYYTGNTIIALTLIWMFITGVTVTTKQNRDGDFAFVSNRLSSNLANIAFLVTAALVGAVTAMLSGTLLKVIIYFFKSTEKIVSQTYIVPPLELVIGLTATFLYALLISGLGYLAGTLVQINKLFVVILPATVIGFLFLEGRLNGGGILFAVGKIFVMESSLFLLTLKVFVTAAVLFYSGTLISNRLEVRR
ncbi:hypothetical protein RJD24_17190 [Bacillaceae bacterium IKA-2]|nr:hypothetical protein RJD24_17190 [Bacillaceae bacterium IKA-2]